MPQPLDTPKSVDNKTKDLIQLISGLISLALAIISFLTKVFESKYSIALFIIGLLIVIQIVCKKAINSTRMSFGVTTNTYSSRSIKTAKVIKHVSWLLILFPVFIFVKAVVPKKAGCNSTEPELGILITSFTRSDDDDFSYKLFNTLESELHGIDSIKSIKVEHFINLTQPAYLDTITNVFSGNCLNHGLLVFGKRSDQSKLFDCNIFINNISTLNINSAINKDHNILFLRNPDVVNFSIDNQANTVSDFILGLLFYNAGNYNYSITKFQSAATVSATNKDIKLKSYCHLFIGNNLVKENNISDAINNYKTGIAIDSLNAYLHYNLATALVLNSDSTNAFQEYESAKRLNPKFQNPIDSFIRPQGNRSANEGNELNKIATSSPTPNKSKPQQVVKKDSIVTPVINRINNDYAVVNMGGKYGVKNLATGNLIIPCALDFIDPNLFNYKDFKFFIVQRGGKFGAVNLKGYLEIPTIHPSNDYVKALLKTTIDLAPETISH